MVLPPKAETDSSEVDHPQLEFEQPPKVGDLCPQCGRDHIDYDGMLNLTCLHCGYTLAGCFT